MSDKSGDNGKDIEVVDASAPNPLDITVAPIEDHEMVRITLTLNLKLEPVAGLIQALQKAIMHVVKTKRIVIPGRELNG